MGGSGPTAGRRARRRIALLVCGCAAALLLLFAAVEPIAPEWLRSPGSWHVEPTVPVAAAAVALLALDAALPVPASVVMALNGTVFGVAVGTLLSTVGAATSAAIAYLAGARSADRVERYVGVDGAIAAARRLERHRLLYVGATRPIPIVAEVAAAAAGAARMPLTRFAPAVLAGAAITSLAYAAAGEAVL